MDDLKRGGSFMEEFDRCICVGCKAYINATQGELQPLFWVTPDGYRPVQTEEFPNRGRIHVTKGYEDVSNSPEGTLFDVRITQSDSYHDDIEHQSKFSTWKISSNWQKIPDRDLSLCTVLDGRYPDPSNPESHLLEASICPTSSFFLRCRDSSGSERLIGPLDSTILEKSHERTDGNFIIKYLPPSRPFKAPFDQLTDNRNCCFDFEVATLPADYLERAQNGGLYVTTRLLMMGSKSFLDMYSDDQILKWFAKSARQSSNSYAANISSNLKKATEFFSESENAAKIPQDIFQQRLTRLGSLNDRLTRVEGFDAILDAFINSDSGEKKLTSILDDNLGAYLEKYKTDNSIKAQMEIKNDLERKQDDADKEFQQKTKELREVKEALEDLKGSLEANTLKSLQTEILDKKTELGLLADVAEMESLIKEKQIILKQLQKDETTYNDLLNDLRHKMSQSRETMKKELIGLKLDLDIIDGRSRPSIEMSLHRKPVTYLKINGADDDEQRRDVIETLVSRLEAQGLDITQKLVTKLVIASCQNLIVTLAGAPGTGKTATATLLAKALGLKDSNKNIHIQVQRGWTTDRDIIGFQNKLAGQYDPDRFGLYEMLYRLNKVDDEDSLSLITLDEANLSPIEYYFSTFMGASDSREKFYTQGISLSLPKGVRFLATINNDRTTEMLSDRFLDRSPVIKLESASATPSSLDFQPEDVEYSEYSFDEINRLFNPEFPSESFDKTELQIIETLREDHSIITLERRKYNAMARFVTVGRTLFSSAGYQEDNSMAALDEAILIHLLPKLKGQGKDFRRDIERLSDYLDKQGLEQSVATLQKIIVRSKHDTYSYFS